MSQIVGERRTLVDRLFSELSPARTSPKAVTPDSVKVLMMVEAGIIGFLVFWVLSEYTYNAFFRSYVDQVLLGHVTTYSAVLGLGIGLAGSAVTAMLYKNLQHAKYRLETVAVPKIGGAVDKVLSSLPGTDVNSSTGAATGPTLSPNLGSSESPPTDIESVLKQIDEKKPDH